MALGMGFTDRTLSDEQVRDIVGQHLEALNLTGQKVLLIIPDSTRTAPVGLLFKMIYQYINDAVSQLDILVALGTHPPMTEEAINQRLEITADERLSKYGRVKVMNHAWNDPKSLRKIGTISAEEVRSLSDGLFELEVDVSINQIIFEYDHLIIVGPVFPHEVVGFSGGNKYLFPGIGGPEILNFFHWLGAVITNPQIIGVKHTPVRKVVDRAASFVPIPRSAICMVVNHGQLAGLYSGTPEDAWNHASDLSAQLHIIYKERPFHTVLSCAPAMYDELWVGGKCMYKLEPVVADDGELIIYAPHIAQISQTHGRTIERIGYHTRDYFLKQWSRFQHEPWGILAHSTHVRGIGSFENGVEKPRIRVTLATAIPPELCQRINLGYRNPNTIRIEEFAGKEDQGILYVPKAGEYLYRLKS